MEENFKNQSKFCPTDEELIIHYLNLPFQFLVDLYDYTPQQLTEMKKDCYFFTTTRNRDCSPIKTAGNGYWVSQGIPIVIYKNNQPIGIKKIFNFYQNDMKITDWIMQQFTLHPNNTPCIDNNNQLEEWVLCNIYKAEKDEFDFDQNDEDVSDQDSPIFIQPSRSESFALRPPLQGDNGNICSPGFDLQLIWSSPPKLHEIDIIQMQCCAKQSSVQDQQHHKGILDKSCLSTTPGYETCYPEKDFPIELSKLEHHSFPCCTNFSQNSNEKRFGSLPNQDRSVYKKRRLIEIDSNQSCNSSRNDCYNPFNLPKKELIFPEEDSCQLEKELNDQIELEQTLSVDDSNFVNDILEFLVDHAPLDIPTTPECCQR